MSTHTRPMTTTAMLAELTVTFPQLWKRPLVDFAAVEVVDGEGVWTGMDTDHRMPDGLPIFNDLADGDPSYDGAVHTGFAEWLRIRGWFVVRYDGDTFFLLPDTGEVPLLASSSKEG